MSYQSGQWQPPWHLEQSPLQQPLPAFLSFIIFLTLPATMSASAPPTIHVAISTPPFFNNPDTAYNFPAAYLFLRNSMYTMNASMITATALPMPKPAPLNSLPNWNIISDTAYANTH